jgi:hypothetical protein
MSDTKDRINVRMKSLKIEKISNRNRHDFREYKNENMININQDLKDTNINMKSKKEEKLLLDFYKKEYEKTYKLQHRRKPQYQKVSPFLEGVITFPNKYQDKDFTREQWNKCLENFIKNYEEETGLKIINIIEHNDETTRHYHFKSTSYKIENNKIIGNSISRKNFKSRLQDIAGAAYSDLGLRRGNKSKAKNQTIREYYSKRVKELEDQLEAVEQNLNDELLKLEDIEELISTSEKPLKNIYIKYKRLMKQDLELEDTKIYLAKINNDILKKFPMLVKYKKEDQTNLELLNILMSKVAGSKEVIKTQKELVSGFKK